MSGKLKTTSKEAAFQAQFEPGTLPYVHQKSKSSRFPKSQAVCPHGQFLRQKAQRFKVIVEAVEFPAKNFFVVLLFLFQYGDFVDLFRRSLDISPCGSSRISQVFTRCIPENGIYVYRKNPAG